MRGECCYTAPVVAIDGVPVPATFVVAIRHSSLVTRHSLTVTDVAWRLLRDYGGLLGLSRADYADLCREHGLGEAKAARLKACV